jgi:hypothetical protein
MAEQTYQRLNGDRLRLERKISYVKRGINTSKKYAQGVDYSEELRAKSLEKLKKDQAIVKDLESELKKVNQFLNKIAKEERKVKGQKQAKSIEAKYAKLQKALSLQLDPNSADAKKIKEDMAALASDYQSALTSTSGRAVSILEARSKLTNTAVPSINAKVTGPDTIKTVPTTASSTLDSATKDVVNKSNTQLNKKVITPAGKVDPGTAAERMKESTGNAGGGNVKLAPGTKAPSSLDAILARTEYWYDLPDYIFKLDPKLGELLVKAVAEGWDDAKFLASAKLTPWWQKNNSTIRERIVARASYNELRAAGEDVSKSDYGLYLSKQMNSVKAKAFEIAGVRLTDEQAQSVAQKIYDGFLDDDPFAINALIVPFIGKVNSIAGNGITQTGYSGQALQNYQTLQAIAKANGFNLRDILPNISATTTNGDLETAVLQGLAAGTLDVNRISQDARMLAAQGQPQYVRDLLAQGYDLENVYAPYRSVMANELELDPNTINLNDPTLRMAITDKGDTNMYDFKKAIRADNRWQYTQNARSEVSTAALGVLKDFGFQG